MGVAVVVVPGELVLVRGVLGGDAFEGGFEVVLGEARFELDGGDRGGGADVEEGDDAIGKAGAFESGVDIGGDIKDVAVAVGVAADGFGFDHGGHYGKRGGWGQGPIR